AKFSSETGGLPSTVAEQRGAPSPRLAALDATRARPAFCYLTRSPNNTPVGIVDHATYLARPKRFELLTPRFVVGRSLSEMDGAGDCKLNSERGFVPHIRPRSQCVYRESWSEWQDLNLRPPRPERGAAIRVGPPGQGGCLSWENLRNLLKRN